MDNILVYVVMIVDNDEEYIDTVWGTQDAAIAAVEENLDLAWCDYSYYVVRELNQKFNPDSIADLTRATYK